MCILVVPKVLYMRSINTNLNQKCIFNASIKKCRQSHGAVESRWRKFERWEINDISQIYRAMYKSFVRSDITIDWLIALREYKNVFTLVTIRTNINICIGKLMVVQPFKCYLMWIMYSARINRTSNVGIDFIPFCLFFCRVWSVGQ